MTLEELKRLLETNQQAGMDAIKALQEEHKKTVEQLSEVERKLNKHQISGGGNQEDLELKASRKSLTAFVRGDQKGMEAALGELSGFIDTKDMSIGSDPNGGYFVPRAVSRRMITKLYDLVPMRRLATIETLTEGSSLETPIDRDEADAQWVGETETRSETTSPQVGVLDVPLNEIYALPKATQKLLDMAGFDVAAWIERKMIGKFARTEGAAFVSGNGIKKPRGFLSHDVSAAADSARAYGTLQFVISGAAAAITADSLRDLYWAVRAPYRANAAWLMSSVAASAIDKLKDGNGQYLWRDSSVAGQPPTLLGRPVEFDENMPAVAAGTFPIALGDFKAGYQIVDSTKMVMLRDPFTQKGWVKFYSSRYVGGSVEDSDAIKLLKVAAS